MTVTYASSIYSTDSDDDSIYTENMSAMDGDNSLSIYNFTDRFQAR